MATQEVKLKVKLEAEGTTKVSSEIEDVGTTATDATEKVGDLSKAITDFASLAVGLRAVTDSISALSATVTDLSQAYAMQETAETKLAQVMRNTMDASDEEIQSIKDLCSAQQELGVIGDEVQIAGAQELGTYLEKADTLKRLIPVMNDMVAQQYGLEASQESAVGIATMLGKVMEGQVNALSRYGYSFDEAQEAVLKFGTEEERAAVLADVVGASVGGMNAALAKTDSGRMQQMANYLGDLKEEVGAVVVGFQPFLAQVATFAEGASGVFTAVEGFRALGPTISGSVSAITSWTKNVALAKVQALATATAQRAVAVATKAWSAAQALLNGVLAMNPISLLVVAIGALVAALVTAYNECDEFREVCDKVLAVIKGVATVVWDSLCTAFEKASALIRKAWEWLSEFLGLDGKKAEVEVEVSADGQKMDIPDYTALLHPDKGQKTAKTNAPKIEAPKFADGSIGALEAQLSDLKAQFKAEVDPESRRRIQEQMDKVEATIQMHVEMAGGGPKGIDLGDIIKTDLPPLELKGADTSAKRAEAFKESLQAVVAAQKQAVSTVGSLSQSFATMGEAIGGAAGQMMNWAGQTLSAIAAVLPQILTLITAKQAEGMAGATASGSSLPFPANIIAIGAGVAAVIAQFAKMPKFANGGLAYGPTLGLFGEYAGASNNPEVVAPLDKLKGMLYDVGSVGMGGDVEFRIQGRQLVGVLAKENNIRNRS